VIIQHRLYIILSHQTVKGMYAWCQGCGHGGHLRHMHEWFQTNLECPTGCGHVCTIEMAPLTTEEVESSITSQA
jgi:pyruvate/2-oxoacid:ferredoxin oxidoreductase beta subunit